MTFGSRLCATIFMAERSLAMNACWFKRSIPFFRFPLLMIRACKQQLWTNCFVKMCKNIRFIDPAYRRGSGGWVGVFFCQPPYRLTLGRHAVKFIFDA